MADPYVEVELSLLTIDIFLLKPEAYRHLLFNRSTIDGMLKDFWKFVIVSKNRLMCMLRVRVRVRVRIGVRVRVDDKRIHYQCIHRHKYTMKF